VSLRAFVPALSGKLRLGDQALLERDVRLHLLLGGLSGDKTIGKDLIFKGGTCLIKCHFGYWRFSEDLDFTWRNQRAWQGEGSKKARRTVQSTRRSVLEAMDGHASRQGLSRTELPLYGRSGQMMTVKYAYKDLTSIPGFIKVQVNFREPILYELQEKEALSLLKGDKPRDLQLVDGALTETYATPVRCTSYDAKEILIEKGRALLTRQAAKGRDVLDLFLLDRVLHLRVENYLPQIEEKTRFSIEDRKRYREHLDEAENRFKVLLEEDVRPLLIKKLDLEDFKEYRKDLVSLLRITAERLGKTAE
jgi:predicted nucleotidyltransferase component of viral defense system